MSKIFKLKNIKNCLLVETNIIIPAAAVVLETSVDDFLKTNESTGRLWIAYSLA